MALGDRGSLFVGSMRAGKVYAVRIRESKAAETLVVASELNLPVGVAFRGGALYVSAVQIFRKHQRGLSRPVSRPDNRAWQDR